MSSPPENKHFALRQQLRFAAGQMPVVPVPAADLLTLLDLLTEQDDDLYNAWERSMGDDL